MAAYISAPQGSDRTKADRRKQYYYLFGSLVDVEKMARYLDQVARNVRCRKPRREEPEPGCVRYRITRQQNYWAQGEGAQLTDVEPFCID